MIQPDLPPATDAFVAVAVAARHAGMSERTLRDWIRKGKVPAISGDRGHLVRFGDVEHLARLTGKAAGNPAATGAPAGGPATSAGGIADDVAAGNPVPASATSGNPIGGNPASVAVSPAAMAQLAAIRDEWLRPLVAEIQRQAEEIGRLRERQEQAERRAVEVEASAQRNARLRAVDADQADQIVTLLEDERDRLAVEVAALKAVHGA